MRKNTLLCLFFISMLILVAGCASGQSGKVTVYETTELSEYAHQEESLTAVVSGIDYENNLVNLIDCQTGDQKQLLYNGGVSVYNKYGDDIGLGGLECGTVVDVIYYADSLKLAQIKYSDSVTAISDVSKFTVDMDELKAVYKGTSCPVSEFITAFDGNNQISAMEINTEDLVTLNVYGGKIVSVQIQLGHGYVKLVNQKSYVGGMVEIGYDVIVPVTDDMLLAVREGEYTLRINKAGYCDSKSVTVVKDKEVVVDIFDISIPTGTVTFNIEPADSKLFVNGEELPNHVYTDNYGNYRFKVVAEGYEDYSGKFTIKQATKVYDVTLEPLEKTTETTETTDSTETTETTGTTGTDSTTSTETTATTTSSTSTSTASDTSVTTGSAVSTEYTTEEPIKTKNKIKIKAPKGVEVYVDGDYIGVTPVSFEKIVGTHTIILNKSGYLIKSYTIQAKDDGKDDEYEFAELVPIK